MFYRDLFGWQVTDKEPRWAAIGPQGGQGMYVLVQAEDWYESPVWPEDSGSRAKMMHFEIHVNDVTAATARAIELGAQEASRQPSDRELSELRVLLDPAGHPFCLWS